VSAVVATRATEIDPVETGVPIAARVVAARVAVAVIAVATAAAGAAATEIMFIDLIIRVQIDHIQGRFASKDAVCEALVEMVNNCNPGEFDVEDSSYVVSEWDINESLVPRGLPGRLTREQIAKIRQDAGIDPIPGGDE
jgi:hypothetical protein